MVIILLVIIELPTSQDASLHKELYSLCISNSVDDEMIEKSVKISFVIFMAWTF